MTSRHSLVLIIPAALRDAANRLGDAMGQGPDNYTVALSSDGENVTHYGLVHQAAQREFIETIRAARRGVAPALDLAAVNLTPADVGAVVTSLIMDASPDPDAEEPVVYATPADHFAAVLAENELTFAPG